MKLLALLLIAISFGGCGLNQTANLVGPAAYANEQVYQGYPCGESCEDFQKGYDQAMKSGWKSSEMCQAEVLEEMTGCKAYVADYEYENKSFDELMENF